MSNFFVRLYDYCSEHKSKNVQIEFLRGTLLFYVRFVKLVATLPEIKPKVRIEMVIGGP